jgi:hypothetical protein
MWIQDSILQKKKFTRRDTVVKTSYFTADTADDFILAPPVQSKRKSFITDINESLRHSRDAENASFYSSDRSFDNSRQMPSDLKPANFQNELM